MSAALRALATGYVSVAVLLTVGFVLLRAALALMGRLGLHLSARQTLRRDTEGTAFSTWFPRLAPHPSAWVAVPSSLLEDAQGLRLTVLQAYNQGEKKVDRVLSETGVRDASELARTGHLNDYASTVQAGLLILRNPHLLD